MNNDALRQAFLGAPEKVADLVLPDWLSAALEPGTELQMRDIPSDELGALRKANEADPNGNNMLYSASIICKSLVNKATGELFFLPTDRDAVAHLGTTKLDSLYEQISTFFGFNKDAVANAKKN